MTPSNESLALEWRPIDGFPDYEVCEDSRIRRLRPGKGPVPIPKGRFRKHCTDPRSGYKYVVLVHEGKQSRHSVHGIVLKAFKGPKPTPRHEGAHNDGDPGNNHLENLRWATPEENCLDKVIHGTDNRGEKHWNARLTPEKVIEIRSLRAAGIAQANIAKRFEIPQSLVSKIVRRKRWRSIA